ncbi:MAG TPA: VOC family protein [Gaiellales bacterium]|nr:VOC family protein [Gaiellales bacterium]
MKLEGIHHITCITADVPRNVDFYTRVLGLRMVKKTVNQDDPTVYHLFYADERGSAGSDITFFEYPTARQGTAGRGMVSSIVWRVGSQAALDFWESRLTAEEAGAERSETGISFRDPEGLGLELELYEGSEAPLVAESPDIPREHALQGFAGVRMLAGDLERGRSLLEDTLGFERSGDGRWDVRGDQRSGFYERIVEPQAAGIPGAGTVHHVAWSSTIEDHEAWQQRVAAAGLHPTPVIDRFYFKSIYFREPAGVLFEIATLGPGFATDEPLEHLGERLSLPPAYEHLRDRLAGILTPLPDPRARV